MTGNFDINKELLDAMRIIARQEIERCNRDITKTARVIAVNADETVKIEMDGKQYDNIPNYNGTTLSVNNIVKVTYPQGQASNMYVSGGGQLVILGITDYGVLDLKSESSDPNNFEGSEIALHGMGGNTGKGIDYLRLDANSGNIRIFGNFGGGDTVKTYEFRNDGLYFDGKKIGP